MDEVYRRQIEVIGAPTNKDAHQIAHTIATSPLVKTAVHGGDPNWGRIVTAAGYSGVPIQPAKMSLHIGGEEKEQADGEHPVERPAEEP